MSVEEVRQLSCGSFVFSSCYSEVGHGPIFASSFIESAGRDRRLLPEGIVVHGTESPLLALHHSRFSCR